MLNPMNFEGPTDLFNNLHINKGSTIYNVIRLFPLMSGYNG